MCIMANYAEVSQTSILVASAGQRQLTAYEMVWDGIDRANALILAVPAKADEIELVDLSGHSKIFKKLHELFHPEETMRGGEHRRTLSDDSRSYLQVREVGSYKVSVAPSFEDLDRVNPDLLVITKEAKEALAEYAGEFSFIVAVLQSRGKIHPLAYIHPAGKDGLFVPTKHEHGDGDRVVPEWDHSIYVVGKEVDHRAIFDTDVAALSDLRLSKVPSRWDMPPRAMPSALMGEFLPAGGEITLFTVNGAAPNHDLWL